MIRSEYDKIIRENFDLSDSFTRKYIVACNEDAQQAQVLDALSNALYEKMVAQVDKIDFGSIPRSRGDIDKVDGIKNTEESLNIIRRIVMEMHLDPKAVDVVITAIANLRAKKGKFIKGFTINAEFPILLYNLTVLSIEKAVTLMIAASELVIIDPASDTMKKAMNKAAYSKVEEDVFYQSLISFNNICKNSEFDKFLDNTMTVVAKESVELLAAVGNTRILKVTDDENTIAPSITPDDFFGADDTETPTDVSVSAPSDDNSTGIVKPIQDQDDVDDDYDGFNAPDFEDPEDDSTDDDYYASGDFDQDIDDVEDDTVEPKNIPQVTPYDPTIGIDQSVNELEVEEAIDLNSILGKDPIDTLSNIKKKVLEYPLGRVIVTVGAIAAGIKLLSKGWQLTITFIIPMIRNMIYGYMATRVKLAECIAIQAQFIEANADELEYSSTATTVKDKKKVIEKQRKFAAFLRKVANNIAIDSKVTSNTVKAQVKQDEASKATISPASDDIF